MSGDLLANLDALDTRQQGVRVAFQQVAPRIVHRIGLVTRSGVQWVLASVEGDSHEPFPPSPPLQQLAIETPPGGRTTALLLGMAGRNHWSVAAESHPLDRRVQFDVACRAQVAGPDLLHSVYRMSIPCHLSDDRTVARWVDRDWCLQCVAGSHADGATTLRVEEDRLVIGPAAGGQALTHRWHYTFTCCEFRPTPRP